MPKEKDDSKGSGKKGIVDHIRFNLSDFKGAWQRILSVGLYNFFNSSEEQPKVSERSEMELANICFEALGYMEELALLTSKDTDKVTNIDDNISYSLVGFEKQLDIILKKDQKSKAKKQVHIDLIKERLEIINSDIEVINYFKGVFEYEYEFYKLARPTLSKIRKIDNILSNANQAIYILYFDDLREYKKVRQTTKNKIKEIFSEYKKLLELRKQIYKESSAQTLGFLKIQELLSYKKQMEESYFVLTPSRIKLLNQIAEKLVQGQKIYLLGSVGTGKSTLAIYVAKLLVGDYEIIKWQPETSIRDVLGYLNLVTTISRSGKEMTESQVIPGPLVRALLNNVALIHEEVSLANKRVLMILKAHLGKPPGTVVKYPEVNNLAVKIPENFLEIFTGNPNDEKTERADLDPAFSRELKGIEVGYFSTEEMFDLVISNFINEQGIVKLSLTEFNFLHKLCVSATIMQNVHNRQFKNLNPDLKKIFNVDSTDSSDLTLDLNFLDPQTLFDICSTWKLASIKGISFTDYMTKALTQFINDPKCALSRPHEKEVLKKILENTGVVKIQGDRIVANVNYTEGEKNYLLPSQIGANLRMHNSNPMK